MVIPLHPAQSAFVLSQAQLGWCSALTDPTVLQIRRSASVRSVDHGHWRSMGLEVALLSLVGTSATSIANYTQICQRITAACGDTPQHVQELARLPQDSHRERDLHRWCCRQAWRDLLPSEFEFEVPLTFDGGITMQDGLMRLSLRTSCSVQSTLLRQSFSGYLYGASWRFGQVLGRAR